jgi:hypothetical protein
MVPSVRMPRLRGNRDTVRSGSRASLTSVSLVSLHSKTRRDSGHGRLRTTGHFQTCSPFEGLAGAQFIAACQHCIMMMDHSEPSIVPGNDHD